MKKTVSRLCAVCIAAAMLAGCSAGTTVSESSSSAVQESSSASEASSEAASESSSQDGGTTLRVSWWGSQMRHDQTIEVLEKYMELNPSVNVEYEFNGFSGYWDKIATQAAASNLPDVWQNSVNYILSYVEKGQLLDLTPYTENGLINLSDWDESSISSGKVDDKIYALSMGMAAHCIAYDPEDFEQAGVPLPTMDWTWQDYMDAATQIYQNTGVYGDSDFAGSPLEGFEFYLRQNGQSLFNEEKDGLAYTDDKYFIEYNQMALDLLNSGGLMPIDQAIETNVSLEQSGIVTGTAAMLGACNSNQLSALASASGKELDLVTIPHMENEVQPGNWLTPSMYLCASENNANPEESAKLINFMLNDAAANEIFLGERGVPASSAMRELIKPSLDATGQKVVDYVDQVSKMATEYDPLRPTAIAEMTDLYQRLEQEILFGQITPEDAAKSFRTEAEELLKK